MVGGRMVAERNKSIAMSFLIYIFYNWFYILYFSRYRASFHRFFVQIIIKFINTARSRLLRFPALPPPPLPHPSIHLRARDSARHLPEHDPEALDIPVPALVVEEQHLLEGDAARLLDALEVRLLVAREDLHVIEDVVGALAGGHFRGRGRGGGCERGG